MSDETLQARAGQTVGCTPDALGTNNDPPFRLLRGIKADLRHAGIENEAIDAELAVYNAECRDCG